MSSRPQQRNDRGGAGARQGCPCAHRPRFIPVQEQEHGETQRRQRNRRTDQRHRVEVELADAGSPFRVPRRPGARARTCCDHQWPHQAGAATNTIAAA